MILKLSKQIGQDWQRLGYTLELDSNVIDDILKQPSPRDIRYKLCNKAESHLADGFIDKVKECLETLGRRDVLGMIGKAVVVN